MLVCLVHEIAILIRFDFTARYALLQDRGAIGRWRREAVDAAVVRAVKGAGSSRTVDIMRAVQNACAPQFMPPTRA